jgi:hypothetical protein
MPSAYRNDRNPNGGTSSMMALTLYAQPFQTFFG